MQKWPIPLRLTRDRQDSGNVRTYASYAYAHVQATEDGNFCTHVYSNYYALVDVHQADAHMSAHILMLRCMRMPLRRQQCTHRSNCSSHSPYACPPARMHSCARFGSWFDACAAYTASSRGCRRTADKTTLSSRYACKYLSALPVCVSTLVCPALPFPILPCAALRVPTLPCSNLFIGCIVLDVSK